MKKRIKQRKLSGTTNQRKALFKNLTGSLVQNGYLVTTLAKAKALQPKLDRLVTRAKETNLTNWRILVSRTDSVKTAKKLFEMGKLFKSRAGGYTRILKLANRQGDNSQMVRLEWVEKIIDNRKPKTENKKQRVENS